MRETIFSDLRHTPDRSLAPLVGGRLSSYLEVGAAYTLVREAREGMVYHVLIDPAARLAVQVWDPAEEGEAPVPIPEAPEAQHRTISPELDKDSETDTVAAWVKARGLAQAYVAGAWVWVDDSMPNRLAVGGDLGAELREILKANGFDFSRKRNAYFHKCGVQPRAERPTGRKLSAMHNTVGVGEYRSASYDPRPAWKQKKSGGKKRRAA